ncbi:T9SS type A sorting domain-containing protein [Candidatus Latescibacterota bacterium]
MNKKLLAVIFILGFVCYPYAAFSEEYNILLIRVDFPREDPDHYTTSGLGVFDLRDYHTDPDVREEYTHPWDIPPHNKQYAKNHLEALRNYWLAVSENRIDISYEVWPKESDSAYTMSNEFYKYGNSRSIEQTFEKIAVLFEEAFETCKGIEGDAIDFSKFDTFMVMHAGLGRETSGGIINDIPSAYISVEDIELYLGKSLSFDGITLDNGIIIPEMASTNGIYGLNGIIAQMFGFRLGLPSFSNNKDGISSVGGWSLMDTGNMGYGYNTLGYIPSHPSIWSKIDMGWITPITVTTDTTIDVSATHINGSLPRAVKIPINNDEYLLIENRYNYSPADSLPESITFSGSDSTGVWTKVGHYDAYIPGPGILIWHVNERIIEANRAENKINDDPYRRGLSLLEADGRQDIGTILLFGDKEDTFKLSGNNVLSPFTNPDSGSMWGADSGITVTVNSDPGEVMNVTLNFTDYLSGFPLYIGTESDITSADLNNDGVDEFIVSHNDSAFVYSLDGSLIGSIENPGHPAAGYNEMTGSYDLFPHFGKTSGLSYYHMTDSNLDMRSYGFALSLEGTHIWEGNSALIYSQNKWINIFPFRHIDLGGRVTSNLWGNSFYDTEFGYRFPDSTGVTSFAVTDDYIAAFTGSNTLYSGYLTSDELSFSPLDAGKTTGPLLVDLDRNGVYETAVTADNDLRMYNIDGTYERITLPDTPVGDPVAADIDIDGYPEIIVCTEKQVYAFRTSGIRVENFPFNLPPGDNSEIITSPPVIVDLDGDGNLDIACATSNMRLVSFNPQGYPTSGFPKTVHGVITSSPCIFRLDSAGGLGLAYITANGTLIAHDLGTAADDDLYQWPMWKGGPELTSAFLSSKIPSEITTTAPFEAFCYPNPITGDYGTFRITSSGATYCRITVYTVDGRIVFKGYRGQSDIIPGVANEIRMNADDLSSGLYIAKIETRQKTLIYKLGVLK